MLCSCEVHNKYGICELLRNYNKKKLHLCGREAQHSGGTAKGALTENSCKEGIQHDELQGKSATERNGNIRERKIDRPRSVVFSVGGRVVEENTAVTERERSGGGIGDTRRIIIVQAAPTACKRASGKWS